MARQPGSANFSGTIEALAGGPLDARSIVKTKADLTAVGSFEYPYIGMETYVVSENKKYRLIGDNPLVVANWEEIGSGHEYTAGDGIVIENDEISVDEMSSADMTEIVTPKPSAKARYHKYSTEEQVVGEWIDGKPVYQKTIVTTTPATSTEGTSSTSYVPIGASIDVCVDIRGVMQQTDVKRYFQIAAHPMGSAVVNSALLGVRADVTAEGSANPNCLQINNNRSTWSGYPLYITIQYTKTTD